MVLRFTASATPPETKPPLRAYVFQVIMPHRPPGRYLWDFRPNSPHGVRFTHFDEKELRLRAKLGGELRSVLRLARRGLGQARDADVVVSVGALTGAVVEALRLFNPRHKARRPSAILECIVYPAGGFYGAIKTWLLRLLLPRAHAVVCGSSSEVEVYTTVYRIPRERLHVARLFVADDVFDWPARTVQPNSIFSAGNGQRDYRLLVEAVRGLPVDTHIYTAQNDLDGTTLPARVVCHRPVERGVFLDAMMESELVVLPMAPTPVSAGQMVLLQAMAMGKPVVVTDSASVADYVRDGETALITPCGNAAAMREAIQRLLGDKELRAHLGRQARAAALECYSGVAYAARVEAILEQLAAARGKR